MKRIVVLFALSVSVILLTQCSPKVRPTMASAAATPEEKVAEVKKKYTDSDMAHGNTVWKDKCDKCHKLYAAEAYSVEKWENILPRMTNRAKMSDEDAGKVRAYLLANAKLH